MSASLTPTRFNGINAFQLENKDIRVTVTVQGGHIAEVFDKRSGVSPLWVPPWPSIELGSYSPAQHPEYGNDAESRLLAGIMGHNLCLDLFGPPSPAEAEAGISSHGEAGLLTYEISPVGESGLLCKAVFPIAQQTFQRHLRLNGRKVHIHETVENLSPLDRPIGWTQHVTMGPPFLEQGVTQFRVPATQSRTMAGVDFDWPLVPDERGHLRDQQIYTDIDSSSGYTAHLLSAATPRSWFFAFSPRSRVLFGYVWNRSDFPWLGRWEENKGRSHTPWNNRTVTLGLEFGVSPFPESRRDMIDRRTLFNTPCYRWLPAHGKLSVQYYCAVGQAAQIPETIEDFESAIG